MIKEVMYKQIVIFIIFGMVNGGILNDAHSKECALDSGEIKYMSEMLERERAELYRLKLKFQDAVQSEKDPSEGRKAEDVKEINKKGAESKEKPVDEQNSVSLSDKEGEAEGEITLESKGAGVKESKKAVVNNEKIIHHFEIAENLYKLGEYKTALEIYKLIEKNQLEKERGMWIEYQIANCYRKLELYDEAVKAYRQIQNEFEGTYWGRQAQWYIQDIAWRVKAEKNLKQHTER
jgi:tetratricopeptide (TPR) repeat protein